MSIQNLVSMQINPADVVEINEFILKIKGKLGTGLISLKPEERRAYAKMGDKSLAFVEKALDFGTTYPDLVPPYVDLAELKKDLEAVKVMISILHKLEEITSLLDGLRNKSIVSSNNSFTFIKCEAYVLPNYVEETEHEEYIYTAIFTAEIKGGI